MIQEAPISLPRKDLITDWLTTPEARLVYQTLYAIDLAQHGFDEGFEGGLSQLYYNPEIARHAQGEQTAWLIDRMPIAHIRHAIFIPETGELFSTVDPDSFWYHRESITSLEDKSEEAARKRYYDLVGMIATIKSTGWRIFDTMYIGYDLKGRTIQKSKAPLARIGYVLLWRDWRNREHPLQGSYTWVSS